MLWNVKQILSILGKFWKCARVEHQSDSRNIKPLIIQKIFKKVKIFA